ncbi:Eif2d, partial [Acrasis kona]
VENSNAFVFDSIENGFQPLPSYVFDYNNVIHISTGRWFTLYVTDANRVYRYGTAPFLGPQYPNREVVQCRDKEIISSAGGYSHAFFLTKDNCVLSIGCNRDGQCGLGRKTKDVKTLNVVPSEYFNDREIKSIKSGAHHTLFATSDNFVYSCGRNDDQELGRDDRSDSTIPAPVLGIHNECKVLDLACGYKHSVVLREDGVFVAGLNTSGQLGLSDVPVSTGRFVKLATQIKSISCGFFNSVVQTIDGNLYGSKLISKSDRNTMSDMDYRNVLGYSCSGHKMLVIDMSGRMFIDGEILPYKCPKEMVFNKNREHEIEIVSTEDAWYCLRKNIKPIVKNHFVKFETIIKSFSFCDIQINTFI